MDWLDFFRVGLAFFILIYIFYVVRAVFGLMRIINVQRIVSETTIIVPFRNETEILKQLEQQLQDLFVKHGYKVLFVNDNSSGYFPKQSEHVQVINNPGSGKKEALIFGAKTAKSESIIFFDADVHLSIGIREMIESNWTGQGMLLLPVIQTGHRLNRLFEVESRLIMGLSIGLARSGDPVLANGAGIVVNKDQWLSMCNEINHKYASGDDIFMLHAFKRNQIPIDAVIDENVVRTEIPKTLVGFLNQRIRWAGKSAGFSDFSTVLLGFSTLMMYLLLILSPIVSNNLYHLWFVGSLFLLKVIAEIVLLFITSHKSREAKSMGSFFLLQLIYPIYAIGIPLLSLVYRPKWKGRNG